MIRYAEASDAAGLADVHISSWRSAYRGIFPDSFLDGLDLRGGVSGSRGNWRTAPRSLSLTMGRSSDSVGSATVMTIQGAKSIPSTSSPIIGIGVMARHCFFEPKHTWRRWGTI